MRKLNPEEKARRKKAQGAAYYAKNRERILAASRTPEGRAKSKAVYRAYYIANAERLRAKSYAHILSEEELERRREYDRVRYQTDPSRKPSARREYFAKYRNSPGNRSRRKAWAEVNAKRTKESRMKRLANDPRRAFRYRLRRYNLTLQAFDTLVVAQAGRCELCNQPPKNGAFHIDHDARCCARVGSCGKCIRGLLCANCNTMLGLAKESRDTLASAMEYLDHHRLRMARTATGVFVASAPLILIPATPIAPVMTV